MKLATLLIGTVVLVSSAPNAGLPARGTPSAYPASGTDKGVTVGADAMDPDQVKGSFSTDLSNYLVVEVAVYPNGNTPVDVSGMDFALFTEGRMVRPVEPRSVAGVNQRKVNSRKDDIALYPTVGMTTGTWGTGVGVGVGIGPGGHRRGPASTDRDRRTMELELDEKGLQEGQATKPVAGYLYFPVGPSKKRSGSYELQYQTTDIDIRFKLN